MSGERLFADGGCIGVNPSSIGATFAWCRVAADDKTLIDEFSGVITPEEAFVPECSNNLAELLAVVHGLERLPEGWIGTVYTDSGVTLGRCAKDWAMNGIPIWLAQRMRTALDRMGGSSWVLLDGHPTKAQLASGFGKRGNPVSQWNVRCDKACGAAAVEFQRKRAAGT